MYCPNGDCPYLASREFPAELVGGACPYCGSTAEMDPDTSRDAPAMETIATFRAAHVAHLARGALEAGGIPSELRGEHLASIGEAFADGPIRLSVPAGLAERALEILASDHTHLLEDGPDLERHPIHVPTCPDCGSASIQEAAGTGVLAVFGEIMSGLLGRRWTCLTCGGRWRGSSP